MNDDTNAYYTILHKFTNAPNVVNDVSPPKKEKFSFNLAKKNIVVTKVLKLIFSKKVLKKVSNWQQQMFYLKGISPKRKVANSFENAYFIN